MKKIRFVFLLVAMVAAIAIFAAPAMAATSNIVSYKFYDLNMNGVDDDEPYDIGLPGWWIGLYNDGVLVKSDLTDAVLFSGGIGWYQFLNLEPDMYVIKEAVAEGCWVQTYPLNPNYYTITVTGDGTNWTCQTRFGNVCKRCVKGYTMGFWSNKNGLAALKAYAPGGVITPAPYGPMTIAEIQAMAHDATAVDMCVMLKAQYVAHWLDTHVPVKGKVANYSGAAVIIDGQVVDYDTELAAAQAFITECLAHPGACDRAQAEEYKDFFDGLNNNWFPVNEYFQNACDVPTWNAVKYPLL